MLHETYGWGYGRGSMSCVCVSLRSCPEILYVNNWDVCVCLCRCMDRWVLDVVDVEVE